MKKIISNTFVLYISLLAILLSGCGGGGFSDPVDTDNSSSSAGTGDFSTFVAIGDSLTAGFADGALYINGQQDSLPAIMARQFEAVGGGSFTQPLMNDNLGGLLLGGNPIPGITTRRILTASNTVTTVAGTPTTEVSNILSGPFNNYGVPGAKSFHLLSTSYGDIAGLAGGTSNPYFVRFASSSAASMIGDAASQVPSYFLLWIGNNDILSFATSGGVGVDRTGDTNVAGYGSNDISDPGVVASVFDGILNPSTGVLAGVSGIVLNIPDVSTIPFFTTVPFNPLPLDATSAAGANAAYAAYNAGLQTALAGSLITADEATLRTINFAAGANNAVVIDDEDLTDLTGLGLPSIRQATADDFILLTSSTIIGTEATPGNPATVIGVGTPLADANVLTMTEALLVETARQSYNTSIAAIVASNPNVVLFDVATLLDTLNETGIDFGTGLVTSTFASGDAFSLDGVHPTARGYAVIANNLLGAIETQFGATLPRVDPIEFSTIFFE